MKRRGFTALGGMKVHPDGTVTYEFDGHVIARGVDLQAAAPGDSDPTREIRWLNTDGEQRASLKGFVNQADGGGLQLATVGPPGGGGPFGSLLRARASVTAHTMIDGDVSAVRVAVASHGDFGAERTLVDSDGHSDWAFADDIPDTSEMVTCATHQVDLAPFIGGIAIYLDGDYAGYVEVHN